MKFAHEFHEALSNGGFPSQWVDSAISYKRLKKCIKNVQKELEEIGLNAQTLNELLKSVESKHADRRNSENRARPFQYILAGQEIRGNLVRLPADIAAGETGQFRPKLLFTLNADTGEPLNATLSADTKDYLHRLAVSQNLSDVRVREVSSECEDFADGTTNKHSETQRFEGASNLGTVEVPLRSDSEFFSILGSELANLKALQAREQHNIGEAIIHLSKAVTKVAQPSKSSGKSDLAKWRAIFELYMDSNIFFSTAEHDHGPRTSAAAQEQLQKFSNELRQQGTTMRFRQKGSAAALEQFININIQLVKNMRFQEINQLAKAKILKKFDKRTAFGVKNRYPLTTSAFLPNGSTSEITKPLAKAICYQLSTDLLSIVPQLNDYLCPVCFNISYRPIRLRCQHVFCIRCLVVMQKANENHCPLCRGEVVMETDSTNIDTALQNFLITYFPDEVRAKQKANEHAAGVDKYGEDYDKKCCLM